MNFYRLIYFILFFLPTSVFSYISEYTPSIEILNYQSDLAYIITAGPEVVVAKDYKSACQHLTGWGYTWKILPHKSADPACYSATSNVLRGADTWWCADGSLAYYNIPWWYCPAFRACPNLTWSLSEDKLTCIKPTTSCTTKALDVNLSEVQLIAAIAYAEGSPNGTYEEKAAIANALVRRSKNYGYASVNDYLRAKRGHISSINDKNVRLKEVLCSTNLEYDYPLLYEIAMNALDPNGIDYSNGACFWDGIDLKTDGTEHNHFDWGYKFTNPSHDVFNVGDTPPQNEIHPAYDFTYESTAGYGKTVFWKYTDEYLTATGRSECD